LIRRDRFQRLGGWDEKFPFGGEDLDLSRRVGREGAVVYLPSAEVTHFGRVSSRRNIGWVVRPWRWARPRATLVGTAGSEFASTSWP
jgi:GT2 family glycosyltransferase